MVQAMDAATLPGQDRANQPPRRLLGLDALRGIAAMCVLAFHAAIPNTDFSLGGKGYLAVDFFFMLSGYVMSRTYEHRFALGYSTKSFMFARYRRLWPVMAISALIGAPMVAMEMNDPGGTLLVVLANLALIPAVGGAILFPVNSAAWSILAELAANLTHRRLLWRLGVRNLALFCAAALIIVVWTCMVWGTICVGAVWSTALLGVARALLAYSAGIILWRVWRDEPGIRIHPLAAFIGMPAVLAAGQLADAPWLFEVGFVLLACPLLIAGGLAYRGNSRLAAWTGMISFPLYAINTPLMHWAKGLGIGAIPAVALTIALASYLAIRLGPGSPELWKKTKPSLASG
jgi:peptidoglycan/LPS O-acetylase OafA/YrhL